MSSYTALDLISSSLRLLGVLASGEAPSASESTDGLNSLNDMLDSWSTQNLLIPNRVREVFPLVSSQQAYTMGTDTSSGTPDFNTSRPMEIENVLVQVTGGSTTTEYPVKLLTKDEFAGILVKNIQSTFPTYAYVEGTYPNETIDFWPIPSSVNNIVIYSAKPLSNLSALTTVLSLNKGYAKAIKYNLALELAPEYGKSPSELVVAQATTSKADVKRMNHNPKYLFVDDAIRSKPAVWNWRTGEPT